MGSDRGDCGTVTDPYLLTKFIPGELNAESERGLEMRRNQTRLSTRVLMHRPKCSFTVYAHLSRAPHTLVADLDQVVAELLDSIRCSARLN